MLKAEKEFKRRVGKMDKHVEALLRISPDADQRTSLYEIREKLEWMEKTREAYFRPEGSVQSIRP